jgi:hypothetical protein
VLNVSTSLSPEKYFQVRFEEGTALSKVFRLIDRFSEELHISLVHGAPRFTGRKYL